MIGSKQLVEPNPDLRLQVHRTFGVGDYRSPVIGKGG
jgi:hypothetical protein